MASAHGVEDGTPRRGCGAAGGRGLLFVQDGQAVSGMSPVGTREQQVQSP